MNRAEWLKRLRIQAEALYDHLAPGYWVSFGLYDDTIHRLFLAEFLERLEPHSAILDAACGAGRFDGFLLEAGHKVLGIDQSSGMLSQAREHFPQERFPNLRYEKLGLQEMDFQAQFDGVVCIDALEHVCPEDWPGIVRRFHQAIKPNGVLYITVELSEGEEVLQAYERAKALGLPVVMGEIVDRIDEAYPKVMAQDWQEDVGRDLSDGAVYHFLPALEQVHAWFEQTGFAIEAEGEGQWYSHFLARKKVRTQSQQSDRNPT